MRVQGQIVSAGLWLTLALTGACARDASSPGATPVVQSARAAAGGGKGGTKGPTVTATDPRAAAQNVTLDVRVLGSGFDVGSRVTFERGGVASPRVVTNATTFVSSTELIANVTVAADADTAKYDVAVTTAKGIKGIGSVLFEIVGDPPTTWLIPVGDATLAVTGEGAYMRGEYSAYQHGVCGVMSRMFATLSASNSGDAVVNTHNAKYANRKCAVYPRKLRLGYPDGTSELADFNANVQAVQNTVTSMPIGTTAMRAMNIAGGRCGVLKFRPIDKDGIAIGGDSVAVTRVNSFTWDVQTRPYPDDKAYCVNTGQLYHMPLRLRIESELPLP